MIIVPYQISDIIGMIPSKNVTGDMWMEFRKREKKRKVRAGRKGSSADAKVFQFSTLKHEPTPQSGRLRRSLNKTLIKEHTVAWVLLGTVNSDSGFIDFACMEQLQENE